MVFASMADPRHSLGRQAEEAAAAFLERAGLTVVERNVRFPLGELDLVCRDGRVWVFVEVKCRQARWGDAPTFTEKARKPMNRGAGTAVPCPYMGRVMLAGGDAVH